MWKRIIIGFKKLKIIRMEKKERRKKKKKRKTKKKKKSPEELLNMGPKTKMMKRAD